MALAFLTARARLMHRPLMIADNAASTLHCMIVDHNMRQGSQEEARAVMNALGTRLDLSCCVMTMGWAAILREAGVAHPKDLPNFETAARRLRYRLIASRCANVNIGSLLLAHHEDDQYETVLMRLLSGHGPAGLQGMRAATDIPESNDIYGAYQSGFLDDQLLPNPKINFAPSSREAKKMRQQMMEDLNSALLESDSFARGSRVDASSENEFDAYVPRTKWRTSAPLLGCEDGGVMIYRPLLGFSKDRLIATCEANGVPWFEDATNHDPTLTMRNAVRHVCKNYTLPVALQKPAILAMSSRLRRQAELDEEQVTRLLKRTVIRDLETTSGTVIVQLPAFRLPRIRGNRETRRAKRLIRLEHHRNIATLLVKRLAAMVAPEMSAPSTNSIYNHVIRLFPSVASDPRTRVEPPKPFNVAGVHFVPVHSSSKPNAPCSWHLSREPYISDRPLPYVDGNRLALRNRWRRRPEQWTFSMCPRWQLWDGRFWVRIFNRTPVDVGIGPFDVRHAKRFRDALPDNRSRDELMALLKLHAPGKVRWTLPALYASQNVDEAVREHEALAEREKMEWVKEGEPLTENTGPPLWKRKEENQLHSAWEKMWAEFGVRDWHKSDKRQLLALPTLGIGLPGYQSWVKCHVRYKRVDKDALATCMKDEGELKMYELIRAQAKARGKRRWMQRTYHAWRPRHMRRRPFRKSVAKREGSKTGDDILI